MTSIVVIDLEMTCCEHDEFEKSEMETIEIGAVRQCTQTWVIESEFQSLVKPVQNPILTKFCESLLGISQQGVDHADTFDVVWLKFLKWLGVRSQMCSWGTGDMKWLQRDCLLHNQRFPFKQHCNLFRTLGGGQKRLLRRHGLEWFGSRHRALNDAKTYAAILAAAKPEMHFREIE